MIVKAKTGRRRMVILVYRFDFVDGRSDLDRIDAVGIVGSAQSSGLGRVWRVASGEIVG